MSPRHAAADRSFDARPRRTTRRWDLTRRLAALLLLPGALAWSGCGQPAEAVAPAPAAAPPAAPNVDTEPVFKSLAPPTINGAEPYHFKALRTPTRPNDVAIAFPPADDLKAPPPATPPTTPLAVSRYQPEGHQDVVGTVNATFNQPMVPLASLEDLKSWPTPLEIEPRVPGRFHWLGTSTVEFQPDGRMPFATSYTVRVPVGTKSATGATLAKAVRWTFDTPRPQVTFMPDSGRSDAVRDQLIQLTFNQKVNPELVRRALSCRAAGRTIGLKASVPETDPFQSDKSADVDVRKQLFFERNVFVRPATPLPLNTEVKCELPRGFVGAEGPLPMAKAATVSFRTYAPLKLEQFQCGWGSQCQAEGGLIARFNNQLDPDQDGNALVQIEPAVPELKVVPQGDTLVISGDFQPSQRYRIRLGAALTDVHRQQLGHEVVKEITFDAAEPQLVLGGTPQAVLEAVGPRMIPVHSTNITSATLRWFPLAPKDFARTLRDIKPWEPGDPFSSLTPAGQRTLQLGTRNNNDVPNGISVDTLLAGKKYGLVLVDLEAKELARRYPRAPTHRTAIIQVSDLGVTAHLTQDVAIVLVTSLSTGRPVAGATVSLMADNGTVVATGATGATGIVELAGPGQGNRKGEYMLLAQQGEDRSLLVIDEFREGDAVSAYLSDSRNDHRPTLVSSLFTDRQPYKPGETVHLAGVVRVQTHGIQGGLEPVPPGAALTYTVTDSRGQKTHEGRAELGPLGVFSVDLKLATDAFLGEYSFQGTLDGGKFQPLYTSFQVQEFRTPEYKVSIDPGAPPYFVNDDLRATIHGDYFFGGAMSGATARWTVTRFEGSFSPPGNPGFSFGDRNEVRPFFSERRFSPRGPTDQVATGSGKLDAMGTLAVNAKLAPDKLTGPVLFRIDASVMDANRQAISATNTVIGHAGGLYPGLRIDRSVAKEGESILVQAITADLDGHRHDPPSKVELALRTWERKKEQGGWSYGETETPVDGCDLAWSRKLDEPASCRLKLPKAGNFVLRVRARDEKGRENVTSAMVWAYGQGWTPWFQRNETPSVQLVADRPEHAPGETAQLLIRSPFPRSVGILAVQREGLIEYRALDFEGAAHGEAIKLTEAELPNVNVTVSLMRGRLSPDAVGAAPDDPEDPGRPMYAGGTLMLPISKKGHDIAVTVTPDVDTITPGAKLGLKIETKNAGRPIASRLAIAVVDEGVLSLLGYSIHSPLEAMFPRRPGEGGDVSAVPLVMPRESKLRLVAEKDRDKVYRDYQFAKLASPSFSSSRVDVVRGADSLDAIGVLGVEESSPAMTARTFFASTAYFSADQKTDASGAVHLTVPMPENLTRYRIMVVAVGEGERFGEGDGGVQVRKPVMVRPSLPRFLNLGDRFLASSVVNNQTKADLWIDVQAKAANGTVEAKRQRVFIKAGDAQEVAFEAAAGVPGVSRWQFAAVAVTPERWNDAAELEVPVQLPATVEAFATYGTTEGSVLQPLQLPKDALPDFGGLEVSMSSTALTGLTDAVSYLSDYPYECVEQTASRILPLIVLKKIVTDFHLKDVHSDLDRDKLIKKGLERIWSKQRDDGGFGYWADSRESYLYVSAWTALVVHRAKVAGYDSDDSRLQRLRWFLQQRLGAPRIDLGEEREFNSQAMAALVLALLGDPPTDKVRALATQEAQLAVFGKAWLMEAAHLTRQADLEADLNRQLQSAAVQKASSAHFAEATSESHRLLMHSDERTDAIVLTALLHVRPTDPLIPKIIHGLNESRHHGRWDTTQSNAWGTIAISDYYDVFEKTEPHFDANIFVGDGFVGQGQFSGRETKILTQDVPLAAMAGQAKSDVVLEKSGQGRLYYRLGLKYAPKELKLAPEEQGFVVKRSYLPMTDDPGAVTTGADGTIHIKAGADVRVKLEIVVSDRAQFVAVDDPLPAGLEAVNTSFLTNQSERLLAGETDDVASSRWWWWQPFNHTEMRDDRVALFADSLPSGVYTHTYLARATARGTFQVPPARAFEMYEPENFGRTASAVVVVE